jgi:hypothetical protein
MGYLQFAREHDGRTPQASVPAVRDRSDPRRDRRVVLLRALYPDLGPADAAGAVFEG